MAGAADRSNVIGISARFRCLEAALQTFITGKHVYYSTGCLHAEHEYCSGHTGLSGVKTPSQCKFDAAGCICSCHNAVQENVEFLFQ